MPEGMDQAPKAVIPPAQQLYGNLVEIFGDTFADYTPSELPTYTNQEVASQFEQAKAKGVTFIDCLKISACALHRARQCAHKAKHITPEDLM